MSDYVIRQGDTLTIAETLEDSAGKPVSIEGATVTFTATPIRGGAPLVNADDAANLQVADGSDGSKGHVQYAGTTGQTDTPGDYLASFTVTFLGGAVQTFPNDGYILVTITPQAPTSSMPYVTVEELKKSLSLSGQSYADVDIATAVAAAGRGLEDVYGTRWVATENDVRYYTRSSTRVVELGDVQSITEVALDYSLTDVYDPNGPPPDWDTGLGSYSTILDPSWYRLLPTYAGPDGNGEPFDQLQLNRASQRYILPSGIDAIRITGSFGWSTTPAGVRAAVTMIASRLLRRTREAPFGIIAVGSDGAAIRARDIANDPDIRFAMGGLTPGRKLFV